MRHPLAKIAVICILVGAAGPGFAQDAGYQAEMDVVHKKMMEDMMGMKPSDNPDKDFAMMMIPHHQGAVEMAEIQLKYGKDPALKKMAREIIDAQKKEIAEFKKWEGEHN
jgi:uncharacterized protein (DUF305 family)